MADDPCYQVLKVQMHAELKQLREMITLTQSVKVFSIKSFLLYDTIGADFLSVPRN